MFPLYMWLWENLPVAVSQSLYEGQVRDDWCFMSIIPRLFHIHECIFFM